MKFTANDYGTAAAQEALAAGASTGEAALAYNRAFTARVYALARHHARRAAEAETHPETRMGEWERLRRYRERADAW